MRTDRLHVALLGEPPRAHGAAAAAHGHDIVEHVAEVNVRLAAKHAHGASDVAGLHVYALAQQARRFGEKALRERDVLGIPLEQDLVATQPDGDARLAFEDLEPLVARTGQREQDRAFRRPRPRMTPLLERSTVDRDRRGGRRGLSCGTRRITIAAGATRRPGSTACATTRWRPCARRERRGALGADRCVEIRFADTPRRAPRRRSARARSS